jgi:hypothetical protein
LRKDKTDFINKKIKILQNLDDLLSGSNQFCFLIHLFHPRTAGFHLEGTSGPPTPSLCPGRHEMGKQLCLLQQEVEPVAAILLLK